MFRNSFGPLLVISCLALVLTGCGKPKSIGQQESEREAFTPELMGTWSSRCENNQMNRVTFETEKMTVERNSFADPECQDARLTVRQTGTFKLAHNYKTGIPNSIILTVLDSISVTFQSDTDTDRANDLLVAIQDQKETRVDGITDPDQKRKIMRNNLKIRAGKQITTWKRGEEKTLTRLQQEKLVENSVTRELTPVAPFGSRVAIRYELDNGILQMLSNFGDFAKVFAK